MKNYEETINSVFDRIGKYEIEKKRKRKAVTRTVASLCCFCLIALMGIGVWQSGFLSRSNGPSGLGSESSTQQGTDRTDETNPNNTESAEKTPDAPVIWGVTDGYEDQAFMEWNGKTITLELHEVLCDEKNQNRLIAIKVDFKLDRQFVYHGKSIAEYSEADDAEDWLYWKCMELLKMGDELKYGEALYTTGGPDGVKWTKECYEERVAYFGKDLLAKYIVDGSFLREKLESDIAEYKKRKCRIAFDAACEAYYQFALEAAMKQLEEEKNIGYVRINERDLVIYATAEELASLPIDHALFGLAHKEGDQFITDENDDLTDQFTEDLKITCED